ncbi:hypothetical protein KKB40_00330, partial [Patescibacteria group bacterium]|nr:hypothetical protein [Patescibacteria group bacterium]
MLDPEQAQLSHLRADKEREAVFERGLNAYMANIFSMVFARQLECFVFFLLFSASAFAQIDRGCLDSTDINMQNYPKSLLLDFVIINNGDMGDPYSYIGGYFS